MENLLPTKKINAAANLAKDLCLKMIEHRSLGPDNLASALKLLNHCAQNLFLEINDDDGPYILRLARDFTLKSIERKQVSAPEDVAVLLNQNAHLLFNLAQKFSKEDLELKFQVARDLSLKLLETGRLGFKDLPEMLEDLLGAL